MKIVKQFLKGEAQKEAHIPKYYYWTNKVKWRRYGMDVFEIWVITNSIVDIKDH